MFEIIIALPILIGLGLLYWGSQLTDEHAFLKFLFQMLNPPLWFLSLHLAVIGVGIMYGSQPELVVTLTSLTWYLGIFMLILGAYIMIYLVIKQMKVVLASAKAKREARHGD